MYDAFMLAPDRIIVPFTVRISRKMTTLRHILKIPTKTLAASFATFAGSNKYGIKT